MTVSVMSSVLLMQHKGAHDSGLQQVTSCSNQKKTNKQKNLSYFFEANKVRCLSANRNPPGSLQKAVNSSIFAWVLLVFLLLRHLLIISSHSITADISMLTFPPSPFLCSLLRSTQAQRRFFAIVLSWFFFTTSSCFTARQSADRKSVV